MRYLDLTPYRRSTVGYDRLFDWLQKASTEQQGPKPAYDVERLADDQHRITIALPGYAPDAIDVTAHQNQLIVTSRTQEGSKGEFLYRGIPEGQFDLRFQLADHVQVKQARLVDGLLSIDLERVIPEELKPRKIEISGSSRTAIEDASSSDQQPTPAEQRQLEHA